MMTITAIMLPTGGFDAVSRRIALVGHGRQPILLVLLGVTVMLVSCVLDNITTVVVFGPLIILMAKLQRIDPIPYLVTAAILSNIGGMATLIGDPPSVMIGAAAGLHFNGFSAHMGPLAVLAACLSLFLINYRFRDALAASPVTAELSPVAIRNKKIWNASLIILGGMLVLFTLHDHLGWQPWFVAVLGMSCLILISRRVVMDQTFENVEIALLIFVISLFMVVGGVEQSGFFAYVGQQVAPQLERDLMATSLLVLCFVAACSALIDNIALTAALVPVIAGLAARGMDVSFLWWILAAGVAIGGNSTHVGSVAGLYVVTISERYARQENDPNLMITPGKWIRTGLPISFIGLIAVGLCLFLFFDKSAGAQ